MNDESACGENKEQRTMNKELKNYGFSLTEVLLAMATLSIGMIFVAGVFPVAIHFSTVATERTFGAVVADEAFAKVRLYGQAYTQSQRQMQPGAPDWVEAMPPDNCGDFSDLVPIIGRNEFAYPSYDSADISRTRYTWSALCRRVGMGPTTRLVQVTVFVNRRTRRTPVYWNPLNNAYDGDHPVPFRVSLSPVGGNQLTIVDEDRRPFINDAYIIMDDATGRLYRVRERLRAPNDDTIVLDTAWQGGSSVWVVPPPEGGGRYPCIAVYQKVIRF